MMRKADQFPQPGEEAFSETFLTEQLQYLHGPTQYGSAFDG